MNTEFKILDHPADIGIEVYGVTLAELFQNAAVALMSIIIDLKTVGSKESKLVEISASDREQLLVKWLSEILYLYDGQGFVSNQFKVKQIDDTSLLAEVKGEYYSEGKHKTKIDVKAVTYHQLKIEEKEGAKIATVYFDI